MKLIQILLLIGMSWGVQAKTLATYQKKGAKNVNNIELSDAKRAYQVITQATLNAPTKNDFMRDYIRYHVALNEAYQDKSLIKTSDIQRFIVNKDLKKSFEESLYQIYAASKLSKKMETVERNARNLSTKNLQSYYNKNPYVKFSFVILTLPSLASKQEMDNIEARAKSVYQKMKASKQPFSKLIELYSDMKDIGQTGQTYSRSSLYPLLYDSLKKMKPGQMSQPIKTPNGIYIVKLNEVVPFSQANPNDLKEQIFNTQRAEVFNDHFDKLLAQYVIKIDQKVLSAL